MSLWRLRVGGGCVSWAVLLAIPPRRRWSCFLGCFTWRTTAWLGMLCHLTSCVCIGFGHGHTQIGPACHKSGTCVCSHGLRDHSGRETVYHNDLWSLLYHSERCSGWWRGNKGIGMLSKPLAAMRLGSRRVAACLARSRLAPDLEGSDFVSVEQRWSSGGTFSHTSSCIFLTPKGMGHVFKFVFVHNLLSLGSAAWAVALQSGSAVLCRRPSHLWL